MTIGAALWFASRGEGFLYGGVNYEKEEKYICPAKVVLDGLGADELLAGYGRHRVCFKGKGWEGLQSELEIDFGRLWKRNLGRDDRVISDNGRESRFPFLDENVVTFVNSIPLWEVCFMEEPPGKGDKKLLREVGKQLGLTNSTSLTKRAIQFGSRSGRVLLPGKPSRKIDGAAKYVI